MAMFAASSPSPISLLTCELFCRHAQVSKAAPHFSHTAQFLSLEKPFLIVVLSEYNITLKIIKTNELSAFHFLILKITLCFKRLIVVFLIYC